ncbi:MAG: MBL fold metallo-hydrolase, partial [Chloroflexi bacterium]|nr:MBL fold metallo-hydrolase [Chloroflexota bacterium]
MTDREIAPGLWVLDGAVHTGVLVADGHALLVDCCDSVTPERLGRLGVHQVDAILCTQHRRPNVAGAYAFVERGAELLVPAGTRALYEDVAAYWENPANRWHAYHYQPGPQVLARPLSVAREVADGERVSWRGHEVEVLATPGATDAAASYVLAAGGRRFVFSGDV